MLEEVTNDKGNITKGVLTNRIKEIKNDTEFADELEVLTKYAVLLNKGADLKKQIKEAEAELDKKLYSKYKELTEAEIKTLIVDDKWMTSIGQDIKSEMDRISQRLTGRIKELSERYDATLPQLNDTVDNLESKVDSHLKKMGFVWQE